MHIGLHSFTSRLTKVTYLLHCLEFVIAAHLGDRLPNMGQFVSHRRYISSHATYAAHASMQSYSTLGQQSGQMRLNILSKDVSQKAVVRTVNLMTDSPNLHHYTTMHHTGKTQYANSPYNVIDFLGYSIDY